MAAHTYWRILVSDSNSTVAAIAELEMRLSRGGADVTSGETFDASYDAAGAANVFNGVLDDSWQSSVDPATTPQWVSCQFAVAQDIQQIKLTNPVNSSKTLAYTIEYSDDGTNWTTAATAPTVTYNTDLGSQYILDMDGIPADTGNGHRMWQLNISASNGSAVNIADVEMRATVSGADQTTNGAAIGTAANDYRFVGYDAFDGNAATYWYGPASAPWTLRYDFGKNTEVLEYAITAPTGLGGSAPRDWTLEYSDDGGATWTVADTITNETAWGSGEQRVFAVPVITTQEIEGATNLVLTEAVIEETESSFNSATLAFASTDFEEERDFSVDDAGLHFVLSGEDDGGNIAFGSSWEDDGGTVALVATYTEHIDEELPSDTLALVSSLEGGGVVTVDNTLVFAGVADPSNDHFVPDALALGDVVDGTNPQEFDQSLTLVELYDYDNNAQIEGGALTAADEQTSSSVSAVEVPASTISFSEDSEYTSYLEFDEGLAFATHTSQDVTHEVSPAAASISSGLAHSTAAEMNEALTFASATTDAREDFGASSLGLSADVEHSSLIVEDLGSSLALTISLAPGSTTDVPEALSFADTYSQVTEGTLSSTLVLTESIETGSEDSSFEEATLVFASAYELQVDSQNFLVEELGLADDLFHVLEDAVALVVNTETGAAAKYRNWQFCDMVQIGDQVFAMGPEGLCEITGDDDNGEDIAAGITYGFSTMGSTAKNRVDALWFGYTSDGILRVSVETYEGDGATNEYEMEPRRADQPRRNRVKIGKGLNSAYWRIGVDNVAGAAFDINEISADVGKSARRL